MQQHRPVPAAPPRILAFMAMPTFGMQLAVGSSSFAKTYVGVGFVAIKEKSFGNSNALFYPER